MFKKNLQKNIGKTVSAAPKAKTCLTWWRPRKRSWAQMLGAVNETCYVCMPYLLLFLKKVSYAAVGAKITIS